jgi:hypothetical protein
MHLNLPECPPQDLAASGHLCRLRAEDPGHPSRLGQQVGPQLSGMMGGSRLRIPLLPDHERGGPWDHLCPTVSWNPQGISDLLNPDVLIVFHDFINGVPKSP